MGTNRVNSSSIPDIDGKTSEGGHENVMRVYYLDSTVRLIDEYQALHRHSIHQHRYPWKHARR